MPDDSPLERAIRELVEKPTSEKLSRVHALLLATKLWVATDGTAKENMGGGIRLRAACVRLKDGGAALPIFTSREHLLRWTIEEGPSATLPGRSAFKLADSMGVAAVLINHSSEYKGRIDREDIVRLAAGDASG